LKPTLGVNLCLCKLSLSTVDDCSSCKQPDS